MATGPTSSSRRSTGRADVMWDRFTDLGSMEPHVLDTGEDGVEDTVERVRVLFDRDTHRLRAA